MRVGAGSSVEEIPLHGAPTTRTIGQVGEYSTHRFDILFLSHVITIFIFKSPPTHCCCRRKKKCGWNHKMKLDLTSHAWLSD